MITIKNNDPPITVAEKIIMGTKPRDEDDAMSFFLRAIFGDPKATREEGEDALKTVDMFTLEEIEEIARYLHLYFVSHKEGD